MDDDKKAELARQGLQAAELLEPGAIGAKVKGSVKDAAGEVALAGVAAIGRLTGNRRSPARGRAVDATSLGDALQEWDDADAAEFHQRLQAAAAQKAREDEAARMNLDVLRRSFPEDSRELALLIFNCVDLLEELSDDAEGEAPPPSELEKKERLLRRFAELLAPNAGAALESFVEHVVAISRSSRGA